MIEELKLVNRLQTNEINQTPFQSASDIDINSNGEFVRCSDYDGIQQSVLKAIITSSQLNGYGTDIMTLLGKKNLTYLRGKIMSDVIQTLSVLKDAQNVFLSQNPTFNRKSVIDTILGVKSDKIGLTKIETSIEIQTLYESIMRTNTKKTITSIIE